MAGKSTTVAARAPIPPRRHQILGRSPYYGKDAKAGAALIRARSPYIIKNAITGACIVTLIGGIYAYTIYAIKSDDFDEAALPQPSTQKEPYQQGTGR